MKRAKIEILVVSLLVAVVSFACYFTFAENVYYPEYVYYVTLFRDLYFLPLILAGLWFGLRGAVCTSLTITAIYMCVAAVLGTMSDREKAREKALRESENLA